MQTNLHTIATRLRQTMLTLPYKAGVIMVAFSKDRFKYQNWTDNGTVMWQRRSRKPGWSNKGKTPNNAGRAILIQSGRLRRSIRIVSTTTNSVTIGSDVPYAAIHNNGGMLNAQQRVRAHVRLNKKRDVTGITSASNYKGKGAARTNIKFGKQATGISQVSAHDRHLNFRMPRRRFMGESKYLTMQISRMIGAEINRVFK
jgi:phage gpG-like protein